MKAISRCVSGLLLAGLAQTASARERETPGLDRQEENFRLARFFELQLDERHGFDLHTAGLDLAQEDGL